MGLGHFLGLDDGAPRALCADCGRTVTLESDAEEQDCPDCGSSDFLRLAIL